MDLSLNLKSLRKAFASMVSNLSLVFSFSCYKVILILVFAEAFVFKGSNASFEALQAHYRRMRTAFVSVLSQAVFLGTAMKNCVYQQKCEWYADTHIYERLIMLR